MKPCLFFFQLVFVGIGLPFELFLPFSFDLVAQYRQKQAEKRKDKWDNRHRNTMKKFSIGDLVRLLNKVKTGDHGEKYYLIYSHQAYRVIDKEKHVYSVQNINEIFRVNISHIKKVILRWETDLHSDGSYSKTSLKLKPAKMRVRVRKNSRMILDGSSRSNSNHFPFTPYYFFFFFFFIFLIFYLNSFL